MIQIINNEVSSTEGNALHRIGSDVYFKRATVLPDDTADDFEETDDVPPYTTAEYEAKVAALVRERYTADEEFALQRKMLNTLLSPMPLSDADAAGIAEEYARYNEYVELCKAEAPAKLAASEEETSDNIQEDDYTAIINDQNVDEA